MKSYKFIFVFVVLIILAISFSSVQAKHDHEVKTDKPREFRGFDYHRGPSHRFFNPKKFPPHDYGTPWGRPRVWPTCDKFPRICHGKWSLGPDCCKKRCVNIKIDNLNCGRCGLKCKFPEVCCKGTCVNPWNDRKHCGFCHNKCKKGSVCYYGMCSYA